jgi:heat shock protein HslJ
MRAVLMASLLVLGGCAAAAVPPSQAAAGALGRLADTRWQLVQLQSLELGTLKPEDPTRYVMDLTAGGQLAMQLDCNRAVGRWEARPTGATGGSISFGAAAMTRAACPPGSMDTRIAGDLDRVRTYTLDGDRLNLALEANGGVYSWRRMAK